MINFTRAFDSAWERTTIILFQPFDLGKWFVIGFSAFLAGMLQGGNGLNTSFNTRNFHKDTIYNFSSVNSAPAPKLDIKQFNVAINHAMAGLQIGLIMVIALVILALIFGLILLIYWLGARGQFMFLDNIVRNRGAISWPWQYYRRQANSLLVFYLVLILISLVLFLPILGVALVMGLPLLEHHRWPEGWEIMGFTTLGLVYIAIAAVFGFIVFVFREFGVPLMFRQGLLARQAFWASMNLIKQHTGSVVLFVLLRIAIFIGVAILSVIICCATLPCCCLGQWPYIGTVILLPVLIYVKCFTLDCLAQFGPEYDVWTVDVPPNTLTPRPPLG